MAECVLTAFLCILPPLPPHCNVRLHTVVTVTGVAVGFLVVATVVGVIIVFAVFPVHSRQAELDRHEAEGKKEGDELSWDNGNVDNTRDWGRDGSRSGNGDY